MRLVIEVKDLSELEEIREWLAKQTVRIETNGRIQAGAFLKLLSQYRVQLPSDYKFNREEANER